MPKSLVGKVKNKNFAFFWLLIGGSIGNILPILYSLNVWPIFLPSAILSILMAIIIADRKQRPKFWLGIDLLLALVPLVMFAPSFLMVPMELAILLPSAMIIFGCILGIMNW